MSPRAAGIAKTEIAPGPKESTSSPKAASSSLDLNMECIS